MDQKDTRNTPFQMLESYESITKKNKNPQFNNKMSMSISCKKALMKHILKMVVAG
jgi:hypothetical protein